MLVGDVNADYNGIVLFSPSGLREWFGGEIPEGTNLLERFLKYDDGDTVLRIGLIVPVLAITSAGYEVSVRLAQEASWFQKEGYTPACKNGPFGLVVKDHPVIADLAVIADWCEGLDWQRVEGLVEGVYRVEVIGWIRRDKNLEVSGAGYEFVLTPVEQLPKEIPDTGRPMNLFPAA